MVKMDNVYREIGFSGGHNTNCEIVRELKHNSNSFVISGIFTVLKNYYSSSTSVIKDYLDYKNC